MKLLIVIVLSILCLVQGKILQYSHLMKPTPMKLEFASDYENRITGGQEVEPNSIPYQVALFLNGDDNVQYFCGGTLISRNYVMTAAHCLNGIQSAEVILGAHNIREVEPGQVRMVATNLIIHEGFGTGIDNDIGLIRLPEPAPLNDKIDLVDLPTYEDVSNDFAQEMSTQSGWGRTTGSATIADKLQSVQTRIMYNDHCNPFFFGNIKDQHVCTDTTGGKSVCNGDSGGPLVVKNGKQIGISAFVIAFGCSLGWPAGYTRVSEFLGWIEMHSDVIIMK